MSDAPALAGITVRPARESDMAYVYDTWLKALRPEYPDMRTGDFYTWMRGRVEALLSELPIDVSISVAHPDGEPDVIWGWCAGWLGINRTDLWFVYVRPEHRHAGVARRLTAEYVGDGLPLVVRHLTEDARAIKRAHPNLLRYIPC